MVTKKVKRGISSFLRNKPSRARSTMGISKNISDMEMDREYIRDLDMLSEGDMERKWG